MLSSLHFGMYYPTQCILHALLSTILVFTEYRKLCTCTKYCAHCISNISAMVILFEHGHSVFSCLYPSKLTMISLMLSCSQINARDGLGQTPLHLACERGDVGCVRELMEECQARTDVKDKNGETPMHCAAKQDSSVVLEVRGKPAKCVGRI